MRFLSKIFALPTKILISVGTFLLATGMFILLRLIFLFSYSELVGDSSLTLVLESFIIGFRFDAVIISFVVLPLLLILHLPLLKLTKLKTQNIFVTILSAIFSLITFMGLADIAFFENFGSHLNFWAVEYLNHPGLFFHTVTNAEGFWPLIILWLVISAILFWLLRKMFRTLGNLNNSAGKITKIGLLIFGILLLGFFIRGRAGIKPLDWGEAFFSDNQFINQLSLNPVFTLTHSIYEELKDGHKLSGGKIRFQFYDIDNAFRSVRRQLGITDSIDNSQITLERKTKPAGQLTFMPNIVIVIMESWTASKIGCLGGEKGLSPAFDSLANDGILFNNFYANGVRTNRGVPAVLCSFPSLPGRSIMRRYAADHPYQSIAEILAPFDYNSIYAYGGDLQFDNIKGFLTANQFIKFYDEKDFNSSDILGKWGVPDHILFAKMSEEIKTFKRPFLLSMLTQSYHDPFLVPDDTFKTFDESDIENRRRNCFYYTDWAIGQFVNAVKKQPVFDSTIFIFTSDHCDKQSPKYPLSPKTFRVPLLIYTPAIFGDSARLITTTGSQVDILPTLLGLLNIETSHYSWGRDILSLNPDDSGFAVITEGEKIGLIEGSSFLFHQIDIFTKLYDLNDTIYLENDLSTIQPEKADSMALKLNSYIQLANYLSRGRKDISKISED